MDIPLKHRIEDIVIITDCCDVAYLEMRQTLIRELKKLDFPTNQLEISPVVPVKNFSIENASFQLRLLSEIYTSSTTLFLIVVSGQSYSPERIFGKTKNGFTFVGNNSGYLNWFLEDHGIEELYENKTNRTVNGKSFGGKHVQTPTAAKIISGTPFEDIGIKRDKNFLREHKVPEGTIMHIDNFGLMKISHPILTNIREGEKLRFYLNGEYKTDGFFSNNMKKQTDGTWVLFTGSSLYGLPELGCIRSQHSANELKAVEGDVITWEKFPRATNNIKCI